MVGCAAPRKGGLGAFPFCVFLATVVVTVGTGPLLAFCMIIGEALAIAGSCMATSIGPVCSASGLLTLDTLLMKSGCCPPS